MIYKKKAFIDGIKEINGFNDFINKFKKLGKGKILHTVDACKGHLVYSIASLIEKNAIIVTTDEVSAKKIHEDLSYFYENKEVYIYPARDILFYNADVHSMDITAERMKIIKMLIEKKDCIVIIPAAALMNPLSPKETWLSYQFSVTEGHTIDVKKTMQRLLEIGYERVGRVEAVGQYAIRGGIIDIYPPSAANPYRIELWDDEIDSIRTFNPSTQRSIDKVQRIEICSNQEVVYKIEEMQKAVPSIQKDLGVISKQLREEGKKDSAKTIEIQVQQHIEQIMEGIVAKGLEAYVPYINMQTVSILEYIPKETVVFVDEPVKIQEKCGRLFEEYEESMKDRLEYGHILPKQTEFIFSPEHIFKNVKKYKSIGFMNFENKSYEVKENTLELKVYEHTTFYNNVEILEADIKKWKQTGQKIILLAGLKAKGERILDELEAREVYGNYSENLETPIQAGQFIVTKGSLNKGFTYEDIGLHVVADKDIFGKEKKLERKRKKFKGAKIESFLELTPGDYVVHENHGIGVFKGVEQIVVEGIGRDNLKIEYDNTAILYVNINQMDMVQKYVGQEGKPPKLSKLGTVEWKKSKAKVKGAIQNIAKDLIKLYSERERTEGYAYSEDTLWQQEFEALFPYEETNDQIEAIEDVKKDMESTKVMDRLVCGDVGFGKTEVAIRGAFKAVQNSKQVAYLVPTTILAQQHYQRFEERMQHYPIKVGVLSRFRTPKQIKQTIEDIRKGAVDIVIGTHRLLSKDVQFKELGLLIIDEEQRFGVKHKEKLKEIRTDVDVMTLTATPIPRTLHMSLIGVRDMSVLEEAPQERRPVQTYVLEYSEDFIKDAIHRELARDGQVYFLHNQVKDIEEKAIQIQKMVPNARVAFAHGQMTERELENIMVAYIEHEIDVLVCTTIVETGLDIANANTMIINDADRMGLSQLYQLRGRVGRSNISAYAYLLYKKDKVLKEIAEKRLQAIKQFTQLGAGFKIAMRDLEIRGAGNLLGAQQHGHMEAIGYDLYCKMLQEAVALEKGEIVKSAFETTIEMKISAYIPNDYIPQETEKLDIYKRIACIYTEKDYYDVQEEIEDRYGTLPQSVQNLMEIAYIKAEANSLDIVLVSEVGKELYFKFKEDANLNPEKLPELLSLYPRRMKFTAGKETILKVDMQNVVKKEFLTYIKNTLQAIKKLKKTT
ncbi:MAG: transcription-repair coupling factor [Cellulosilyticaceae bacterium]